MINYIYNWDTIGIFGRQNVFERKARERFVVDRLKVRSWNEEKVCQTLELLMRCFKVCASRINVSRWIVIKKRNKKGRGNVPYIFHQFFHERLPPWYLENAFRISRTRERNLRRLVEADKDLKVSIFHNRERPFFVAVTYYSNRCALDKFTFIPTLSFRLHSTFSHYFIALITRRDNRTYESLLLIRDAFIPRKFKTHRRESPASSGHRYDFNASININIVSI